MNLKELAAHLGLSQTTVSRALNGYPEVSAKTRNRIERAAQEFGYHPNRRARSLATGRAMSIGHVIPLRTQHEMFNPVFADFIAGAGETYASNGYDLTLSVVGARDEATIYRDLMARGAVDGIVVQGPRTGDERIELLNRIGLPYIVHGRASDVDLPYCWLDINNRRAFFRATEFLFDLGHRRIALVNGLSDMDFAFRRRAGYVGALEKRGLAVDEDLISHDEMTEVYGHDSARAMLRLAEPPTAFLSSSIITAIGIRRAVQDAGLRIPEDISIITHDDDLSYLKNGGDVPIFTATRSSVREAGRLCGEMLLERIRDPAAAPLTKLCEADLMLGQSTGPAPSKDTT